MNFNCPAFTTGGGKQLSVSGDALAKSRALFADLDSEEGEKMDISFPSFTTGAGKQLSVGSDAMAKSRALFADLEKDEKEEAGNSKRDIVLPGSSFQLPPNQLFSTAGGKQLAISSEAIAKSRALFADLDEEEPKENTLQGAASHHSGQLFATAGSKRSAVSNDSTSKSRPMVSDTNEDLKDVTPQRSTFHVSSRQLFTTAGGKQLTVNKDSMSKSRTLFSDLDEDPQESTPKRPKFSYSSQAGGPRTVSEVQQPQPASYDEEDTRVNIVLLKEMSPYRNKWIIRVRLTKKYEIRKYCNSRGEGKLFSVDLADESGEMRATGFNQECDKYYEILNEGAVYYIKGGKIKSANRQYTSINNDYELTFSSETLIEPCLDRVKLQLPSVTFNFVKLDKLEAAPRDRVIDVIGAVDSCSTCQTVMSRKTNSELKKRDICIVDDSGTSVALTLWGSQAESFGPEGHPIVAVKGVRISDFNGLSLGTTPGSQLHTNPDIPEAHHLRSWYDRREHDTPMRNLSSAGRSSPGSGADSFIPIALAEATRSGAGDRADYYNIKGFISHIRKENCLYKACPSEDCNKKLIDQGTGHYRCERCNKEHDNFKWRMMLQVTISDFSGSQPITIFNDQGECLMGMSAQGLAELREKNESEFNVTMDELLFTQHSFRLRAKMDLYNNEKRMQVVCQKVLELDISKYTQFLLDEIKKMESLPDNAFEVHNK